MEQRIKDLALSDSGEDVPQPKKKSNKKAKAKPVAVSTFAMLDEDSDGGGDNSDQVSAQKCRSVMSGFITNIWYNL